VSDNLAQQAYEAYGNEVGWVAHTGFPMPDWESLPDLQKDGWHAAVAKVVELVL
jgi:hypothetical protein